MDFGNLQMGNFLTISSANIDLNNRGLLLVQGVNDVDSSAGSNGAGKSTIPDCLCWVAFGVTARGVTGDAVVNNHAKKDCFGQFTATEADFEYTIARYRKHTVHKNALTVVQKELSTGATLSLTRGTDKETQEVVANILGCSLDVFQGAIYAGQEKMPDLPGMTDKNLKTLLEEASGTEILAEAYTEARQRLLGVKTRLEGALTRLNEERARSVTLAGPTPTHAQGEYGELLDKQKAHNDGRKARATAHLEHIKPLSDSIAAREKRIAELDEAGVDAQAAAITAELATHTSKGEELGRLHGVVAAAQRAHDVANGAGTTIAVQVRGAKAELEQVDKLIGTPCGECGKDYCAHDLEGATQARTKKIAEITRQVPEVQAAIKETREALEVAQKAYDGFKLTLPDVSAQNAALVALRERKDAIKTLRTNVDTEKNNIEIHRSNAKGELTSPNPWDKAVEVKKEEIDKCLATVASLETTLDGAEDELALYDEAVKVFGPAGVRAQILDMITPFLNEQTREYLGTMSDGNIHATWSTLSRTSKGELREKFNIEVTHDLGGDSFSALSGGEKRKVRLATFMAMQDLVASRATKPLNLFIADEIDHALDDAGLERLMAILERKARERGTVLVISHNELADWIPNNLTVRKVGQGQSTIDSSLVGTY